MGKDPRYPYTYACDYIRQTLKMQSRSDASKKIADLAEQLGIPKEVFARQLANEWIAARHGKDLLVIQ
jgi:hypothetical protein